MKSARQLTSEVSRSVTAIKAKPAVRLNPEEKGQQLIRDEYKLDPYHVIEYLKDFLDCVHRIKDPRDDIERIFEKIHRWKQAFGDLDQ